MLAMDTLQRDFVKFGQYSSRFEHTSTAITTGPAKRWPITIVFDFLVTFSVNFSQFFHHFIFLFTQAWKYNFHFSMTTENDARLCVGAMKICSNLFPWH